MQPLIAPAGGAGLHPAPAPAGRPRPLVIHEPRRARPTQRSPVARDWSSPQPGIAPNTTTRALARWHHPESPRGAHDMKSKPQPHQQQNPLRGSPYQGERALGPQRRAVRAAIGPQRGGSGKHPKPTITGDSAAVLASMLPGAEAPCEATPVGQPLPKFKGQEAAELVRRITEAQRSPRGQA